MRGGNPDQMKAAAALIAALVFGSCQDEHQEPRPDPVHDRIRTDSIQVGPAPIIPTRIPDCWPEDGDR